MSTIIDGSASVTINSGAILGITSGTAVASTSGTSIDFTGIPSWVKRITVMFYGVSTNNTSNLILQVGAGAIATSGYSASGWTTNTNNANSTTYFLLTGINAAAYTWSGNATLCLFGSNVWTFNSTLAWQGASAISVGAGNVALGGTIDRVRISSVTPDTFDAGSINILYEG
jgi:hypothetical protein